MQLSRRCFFMGGLVAATAALPTVGWAATPAATEPSAVGLVRVLEGRELLRDCVPWVPRGLSYYGRLTPRGWKTDPSTTAARDEFGQWIVDAVKWMGGDVVRLQVGMPFLDPASPQYAADYMSDVKDAVRMARSQGMTVILSLQYQPRTNVKAVEFLPKESARRSWHALGPVFAGDLGVIYELFNEPAGPPQPDAARWEQWRKGHQVIIDDLRRAGIANTLIVDGLSAAHTFHGAPALNDPLRQLAYGVHPYLRENYTTPPDWDAAFGKFAETHPVLVTEWGHSFRKCEIGGNESVEQLLAYLEKRRVGVIGYGADERSSQLIRRNGKDFVASTFRNRECGSPGAGPGELLKSLFDRAAKLNASAQRVAPALCGLR